MWRENIHAHAYLWSQKNTNRIYRVKRWHKNYEIFNRMKDKATFVQKICSLSPIVMHCTLIKYRNELLGKGLRRWEAQEA